MPFLIPLTGLIVGILMANQVQNLVWGLILIIIGAAVYLGILRHSADPLKSLRINPLHNIWIFLIFTGIGFTAYTLQKPSKISDTERGQLYMAEGVVVDSHSYSNGDRILAKVTHVTDSSGNVYEKISLNVLITTPGLSTDPGDIIIFPARFENIADNPNFRPNGYPERMRRQGIYYRVKLKENELSIIGEHHTLSSRATALRNNLISLVEKSSLSRSTINFVVALIFGDRSFISEETLRSFSEIGISHILALSGLHVGILLVILTFMLYPLRLLGWHKISLFIAIIFIWGFAILTGLAPSTVRSCIMLTLGVIAFTLQRQSSPINSLIIATFIILLVSPTSLFNVGLQLSVVCVGSILIFAGAFNTIDRHHHPRLASVVNAVTVSLAATFSSWVVISYYFETVPLLFIPANFLFLPVLPLFMSVALLYIVLLSFGVDITFIAWSLDNLYMLLHNLSNLFASIGETSIHYKATLPVVFCWLAGIITLGYGLKQVLRKKKIYYAVAFLFFGLSTCCVFIQREKGSDEMIIQNNFRQISLVVYEGEKQFDIEMPLRSIGRLQKHDVEIISIDCLTDTVVLKRFLIDTPKQRERHLILSGGSYGLALKEIPGIREFDKIILHSSIRRKMEATLIDEAKELGLTNIHSLREDGPLKVSL